MKIVKSFSFNKQNSEPWVIWGAASLFALFIYFIQPAISIMIEPIKQTFHTNDIGIGFLSSSFFYTYALMQIPIGVLIDKIGVRRVLAISIVGTFFSCIFFAYSGTYSMALISRIAMGFFSAAAFPCAFCLAAEWFPSKLFPTVVGFTEMLGLLGGACAATILSSTVVMYGWRNTSLLTACFAATVGFIAIYCVKDSIGNKITNFDAGGSRSLDNDIVFSDDDYSGVINDNKELKSTQQETESLSEVKQETEEVAKKIGNKLLFVISHIQIWYLSLYSGMLFVVIGAFFSLWGIPFIMEKYSVSIESAANSMVLAFLGAAIGTPLMAWYGHKSHKKKLLMFIGSVVTLLLLLLLFYLPISKLFSYLLLFLIGLSCTVYIIPFSIVKTIFPKEVCGTAMSFTNAICVSIGTLLLQPLIGWILHEKSGGKIPSLDDYFTALVLIPICIMLSLIFLWKIRTE